MFGVVPGSSAGAGVGSGVLGGVGVVGGVGASGGGSCCMDQLSSRAERVDCRAGCGVDGLPNGPALL